MLTAEHRARLFTDVAFLKNLLLEVHRSKISLHHAKTGYDYPTIRLPHTFSQLAGLSTRICQAVQEGALAFLVVISPRENTSDSPESSVFTRRRSPVRIRPSPLHYRFFLLTILITKWALFLVSFRCETQLAARAAWPPVRSPVLRRHRLVVMMIRSTRSSR